jgi:hypothetical protein
VWRTHGGKDTIENRVLVHPNCHQHLLTRPLGEQSPQGYPARKAPEETGKVPESLAHLADDYEEQVAIMVKNTGHLIQPLLVLIQGGIVLFIILAVFLAYIQVLTSLAGP